MLLNMNTAALGRISTTITGTARILESGEEETWCREQHVENHKFGDTESGGNTEGACFIEGEDVKVIVVVIKEGRISDWKGGVKDWEIEESSDQQKEEQLVNGV